MKIEINIENKAKFFALYWGQKVFKGTDNLPLWKVDNSKMSVNVLSSYLNLKPLSQISDEDAEECGYDNAKSMLKDTYLINSVRVFDYLRSKGYALSWMELSVEEMVEAGWIRLLD